MPGNKDAVVLVNGTGINAIYQTSVPSFVLKRIKGVQLKEGSNLIYTQSMGLWQKPQHGIIGAFNCISVVGIVKSFKMHMRDIHTIIQTDWIAINLKWNYRTFRLLKEIISRMLTKKAKSNINVQSCSISASQHQMPKFVR